MVSVQNIADPTMFFEFTCPQWGMMTDASKAEWTVTENTCGVQTTVGNPYAASDFLFTLNGVVSSEDPITISVVDGVYTIGISPATGTTPGSMSALDYLKAQTYLEPVSKNTVSVAIPVGAVTAITVTDALLADEYAVGDVFSVVNNANGERVKLTVTANTTGGSFTISATGTAATEIPIGGILVPIYSVRQFLTEGTGIDITGGVISNTAPDQTVVLTDGTGISVTGTYPNFTITNTAPDQTVVLTAGAGISITGTYPNFTIAATGGGGLVDGDYGDITVSGVGTVMNIDAGVVGTTELADDAVTLAKMQNAVAANIVLGNIGAAGAIYAELTVANLYTLLGMTGTANRIAIWGGANNLASDVSYVVDAANGTMTIQATNPGLGAGLGTLNVNATNFTGSCSYITAVGSVTQNLGFEFRNTNTGSTANTLFQIGQAGSTAGDAAIQLRITGAGGADYAVGIDNSDAKKFKITPNSATPGGVANSGIIVTHAAIALVGINKDAPAHPLDVEGRTRSTEFINTNNPPTAGAPGTALGTGGSIGAIVGGNNGFYIPFTVGTAPTNNGPMFTITYSTAYPANSFPVFSPAGANTANEMAAGKYQISATTGATFTMTANGTLTTGDYILIFNVFGK